MYNIQSNEDPLAAIRATFGSATRGAPAVTIGIVDGLPDLAHPVLRGAEIEVLETMIPPDCAGPDSHGTGVCSLIFGACDPVRGIAPGCSGLALPIFFGRRADARTRPASQLDLARAITFALEREVSIINVSAGQKSWTPEAETHLSQALTSSTERRVLIVAAAGNDGCPCINLPAGVESVLAVGALDAEGRPLDSSNWGDPYRSNGLLAPGQDLPAAAPGGSVTRVSGTSFATAVVSGVAALLLSIAHDEGYRIDAIDIRKILLESAAPCRLDGDGACDRYLAGSLDASAALRILHRAGRAAGLYEGLSPPAKSRLLQANADGHQRFTDAANGGIEMQAPMPESIAPTERETQGISPSACNCEKRPEDEPKAAVEPQAMSQAPEISLPLAPVVQSEAAGALSQQACACGAGQPPQIVFALGALWFDFGTEARYDALVQQLGDPVRANTPSELLGFLREQPQFAAGLTFILMQDQVPLYAIQPAGPFALQTYGAMLDALVSSLNEEGKEQRVSIPGVIGGSTRLLNGMTVPLVFPDLRGMFKWQSRDLIEATRSIAADATTSDDAILNFLNRVYYELRNLGVAPQDRALNFAATNAFQARVAFADSAARHFALDRIKVTKSPICRPDSDCWDVQLQMFDPENERRASWIYRYTVDVSEVLPVTVGPVRTWAARTGSL